MNFLAYYMDRLNPVIFKLNDKFQLRWYGVAYVMGFVAGYYLLLRWARRGDTANKALQPTAAPPSS